MAKLPDGIANRLQTNPQSNNSLKQYGQSGLAIATAPQFENNGHRLHKHAYAQAKRHILVCKTARPALQNGPFRTTKRPVLQHSVTQAIGRDTPCGKIFLHTFTPHRPMACRLPHARRVAEGISLAAKTKSGTSRHTQFTLHAMPLRLENKTTGRVYESPCPWKICYEKNYSPYSARSVKRLNATTVRSLSAAFR